MDKQNNFTVLLVALISGLLFGIGLAYSEMINPQRVLGFLDLAGSWDPTLIFVMGGALLITFPGYFVARKMTSPLCMAHFNLPTGKDIDRRLVTGGILFGLGWGLAGLCPGPALAGLVTMQGNVMLFVLSMLSGMVIFQIWDTPRN